MHYASDILQTSTTIKFLAMLLQKQLLVLNCLHKEQGNKINCDDSNVPKNRDDNWIE